MKKKKNSKNQIHLYIISFYASPYYMNVFLEVWDGGQFTPFCFSQISKKTGVKIIIVHSVVLHDCH